MVVDDDDDEDDKPIVKRAVSNNLWSFPFFFPLISARNSKSFCSYSEQLKLF